MTDQQPLQTPPVLMMSVLHTQRKIRTEEEYMALDAPISSPRPLLAHAARHLPSLGPVDSLWFCLFGRKGGRGREAFEPRLTY